MRKLAFAFAAVVCVCAAANAQTLTANVPDIAQCHGLLTQQLIDRVTAAPNDPADDFEKWRRGQRTMMELPPHVECQSKLWRALRRKSGLFNQATVPTSTRSFGLQPSDPAAEMVLVQYATSIGANVDPAGGVGDYQGEVQMAANPANSKQLVAAANTFKQDADTTCASPTGGIANTYGTQALFGSADGGATWTYHCAPWPSTLTGGPSGAIYFFGSDPAVTWDASGNAYTAYMLLAESYSDISSAIVVAKSTDSGATWTNLGTVANHLANSSLFDDKEFIAVDNSTGPASTKSHPGRLYVIWDTNNVERVAHSDDGVTWTTVNLPTPSFGQYDIGGNLVVAPDGTVSVIWNRLLWGGNQTGERIVFSQSTDGGDTWTTPSVVASPALLSFGSNNTPPAQNYRGVNSFASIAIDSNPASPYYGYLYVAYNDFPAGTSTGTDLNIYLLVSTNGGVSWSTPVKVNDDTGTATQFFPWVAVDPTDGSVNVSWYDTRLDTSNQKTQIFYARSVNGGISFEPNILITDNGGTAWRNGVNYSNENYSANVYSNANQYGDYAGVVAINRQVHPVWTDSRQFFPSSDTQSPSRLEDMATAAIINCSAPDAPVANTVATCGTGAVQLSWSAVSQWGTNATGGTYSIYRSSTATLAANATPIVSGLTATNYTDTTGTPGSVYYYFVGARNNCPGTTLTPMTAPSAASSPIIFPASNSNCAGVTGTVLVGSTLVSGATVAGGGLTTTTDSNGVYHLYGLAPGSYSFTASATGYLASTANNVAVANDTYVTQNFTLGIDPTPVCLTDTTQSDFAAGSGTNIDTSTSPGDVKLAPTTAIDQQQTTATSSGPATTTSAWVEQSFVAGATGALTSIDLQMLLASGTGGPITVELRDDSSGAPGSVLSTTSISAFANATATPVTATFAAPAVIASGTKYHVVIHETSGSGTYNVIPACASGCDPYPSGAAALSTDSGATWTPQTTDLYFKTHVTTYAASGTLASTAKNSNPPIGADTDWTTLSWTAVLPASTSVKFQAAASNSASGPFNFVGPDGTASTYFTTSGASLAQFNGNQYLATKAFLASSDPSVTPILSDVTACASAVACSIPPTPTITTSGSPTICTGTSVTLTSSSASGNQWYRGGVAISGATGSSYVASVAGSYTVIVSLKGCTSSASSPVVVSIVGYPSATITNDATYACAGSSHTSTVPDAGAGATYAWNLTNGTITAGAGTRSITYTASSTASVSLAVTVTNSASCATQGTSTMTVVQPPATPTISGSHSWCSSSYGYLTVSATANSYQWYLNGNPISGAIYSYYYVPVPKASDAGTYTVVAKSTCGTSAPSAGFDVTVTALNTTVTASGPTTFCSPGSVTLTAAPGFTYLWNTGATTQSITVTQTGYYYATVSANGCSASTPSTYVSVSSPGSPPTISADGPTNFCNGSLVHLVASAGYTNYHWSTGETTQTITVKTSGSYSVTATSASGCTAASTPTVVTVWTPDATVTTSGPTTFCAGGSVKLTAPAGYSPYSWTVNGYPAYNGTQQSFVATSTATYQVTVYDSRGCSTTSAPISVTVLPVPPQPSITPSGPTTFCTGGSVTLSVGVNVPGTYTYRWSTGETTASITATTSGNYSVSLVGTNGCSTISAPTTVTVTGVPATPTITANGPTTYCTSNPTTLVANISSGQWYRDGVSLSTVTSGSYVPYQSGTYTFKATNSCFSSAPSNAITVTVTPQPSAPTIYGTPLNGGPFCPGTTFTLMSTATSGNQWFKDGVAISGATATSYVVSSAGNYSAQVTTNGCTGPMSSLAPITYLSTPTISAPASSICPNGKVTLTASLANGYQWYFNGSIIQGATAQTYAAKQAGDYTVVAVLGNNCSATSQKVTIASSPTPNAAITVPANAVTGTSSTASVADAGAGATYQWILNLGSITSGLGTRSITFTNGSTPGTATLQVNVTNAGGCLATSTANINVTAPLHVASILPIAGPIDGGTTVTLNGAGFVSGASVTFGGVAATNVSVTGSTTLTAVIPAHAAGTVDVKVTNPDTSTSSLTAAFTFRQQVFDPNGDSTVDPSDVFYLVNYLFTNGPAPAGKAGMTSGDANGDGVVDPSDIFYLVNYLFTNGPAPLSLPSIQPRRATSVSGSLSLGPPTRRDGKLVIPVIVSSANARAVSLKLRVDGDVGDVTIRHAGTAAPAFEVARPLAWLAVFDDVLSGTVAEIEIDAPGNGRITIDFDPNVTTLGNRGGTAEATVGNGLLQTRGTEIGHRTPEAPRTDQ